MLTLAWYELLATLISLLAATAALDMTHGIVEQARNVRVLRAGKKLVIGENSGDAKSWAHYLTVLMAVTVASALATSGVDIDVVRSRDGEVMKILRVTIPIADVEGPVELDGWGSLEYLSCVRMRDGALFAAERGLDSEAACEGRYKLVATPTSLNGPGGEVVGCEDSPFPIECTTRVRRDDSTVVCGIGETEAGRPVYDRCWVVTAELSERVIRNALTSGFTDEEILARNAYSVVEDREFVDGFEFRLGVRAMAGLAILAAATFVSLAVRCFLRVWLSRHGDINPLRTSAEVASFYEEQILGRGQCSARRARGEVVIEQRGDEDHLNRVCALGWPEEDEEGQTLHFKTGRRPGVPIRTGQIRGAHLPDPYTLDPRARFDH